MAENPKQKEEREKRDKQIRALYPNLTLMEIGKKYSLTAERVRQVIKVKEVKSNIEKVNIRKP